MGAVEADSDAIGTAVRGGDGIWDKILDLEFDVKLFFDDLDELDGERLTIAMRDDAFIVFDMVA